MGFFLLVKRQTRPPLQITLSLSVFKHLQSYLRERSEPIFNATHFPDHHPNGKAPPIRGLPMFFSDIHTYTMGS